MDPLTELKRIPPTHLTELILLLEDMESWKKLMSIIPKHLSLDTFECPLEKTNLRKYTTDHFKRIERASVKLNKDCAHILIDDWSTSGKIRPRVGHLLYLLTRAEIFRAADYVAVKMLKQSPPERPKDGPAAPVFVTPLDIPTISLSSNKMNSLLRNLDMSTNDSTASNKTIINNMNYSYNKTTEHIVPKILINAAPETNNQVENNTPDTLNSNSGQNSFTQRSTTSNNVSEQSNVSDMIKFSQSIADSVLLPQLSILNNNSELQQTGNDELYNANTDQYIPQISTLLSKEHSTNQQHSNNVDSLPNLSIFRSNSINTNETSESCEVLPSSMAPIEPENEANNDYIPQFSALLAKSTDYTEDPLNSESLDTNQMNQLLRTNSPENSMSSDIIQQTNDNEQEVPLVLTPISPSTGLSLQISHLSPNTTTSQPSPPPSCHSPLPNLCLNTSLPHFSYLDLEKSTCNFDDDPHEIVDGKRGRFLGKGAFGSVYLASGLLDKPIAVKKLFLNNASTVNIDDPITRQFRNEVEILSKFQHHNLLSLVGYSCDGPTYCLLYEYIPGGALCDRLKNTNKLPWKDRLQIALGTAKAVCYLHTAYETPLVHRDIKSANILLDHSSNPKLCDFGLIKLISNSGTANFNTDIFGTSAYMAPEAFRGDISEKLDTFSFGVVLLELLTSLPPIDDNREGRDLVTHVQELCNDDILPLLDKEAGDWMENNCNFANKLFALANNCLEEKKFRPKMIDVTKKLRELTNPVN